MYMVSFDDMMDRVVESVVMANVDASKHNEVDYEI